MIIAIPVALLETPLLPCPDMPPGLPVCSHRSQSRAFTACWHGAVRMLGRDAMNRLSARKV